MITAVILAGGSGTRLWPYSRSKFPKQFLNFGNKKSLFQSTLTRSSNIKSTSTIVVGSQEHQFLISQQIEDYQKDAYIILEPCSRNTAAAISLAALSADPDSVLMVLPADHVITNLEAFNRTIEKAFQVASSGKLVTLGVTPTEANTGYGYIEAGQEYEHYNQVLSFKEKPNKETALKYLKSENYFWNSGMFIFKASVFLSEMKQHLPIVLNACQKSLELASSQENKIFPSQETLSSLDSISIDEGLLEKTKQLAMVKLDSDWTDLGSWSSYWEISKKDSNNNLILGDAVLLETKNSLIKTDKLVTTIGVEDLIINVTNDAVLVAKKEKVQDLKTLVDRLNNNNRTEIDYHREVHRPWGSFDSLDKGDGYQVKKLKLNKNAKISLQKHFKRSEHWVVVSGTARVTVGEDIRVLNKNESVYIPVETIHCLENIGEDTLEIIEVQTGSYLGEDDIVRFEDIYGRKIEKDG